MKRRANDGKALKILNRLPVKDREEVFLTEDGTVYYCKTSIPSRLYVKDNGEEIDADLPDNERIHNVVDNGNSIFFVSNEKIYKASFSSSGAFTVLYLRDKIECEKFHGSGLCSRIVAAKQYVYRLYEIPDDYGIIIDVSKEEMEKLSNLIGIHRGKAFYHTRQSDYSQPILRVINDNIILLEGSTTPITREKLYARDSSPFIYMSFHGKTLHTLNTTTMTFLPSLQISGVSKLWYVTIVRNGEISALAMSKNVDYLVTANLSIEYFRENDLGSKNADENIEEKFELWRSKNPKMDECEIPMQTSIKELLLANTEIYQADDGTIYYHTFVWTEDYDEPERLYVKWLGKAIRAKLPGDKIRNLYTHGNAIFFSCEGKIYKSLFCASEGIIVSLVRDRYENEKFHSGGSCSRVISENKYGYRIWEDPKSGEDAILIEELDGHNWMGFIHRKRAIYLLVNPSRPSVCKSGESTIVIEAGWRETSEIKICASDYSSFVYFIYSESKTILHILDTETMQFLPTMKLEDVANVWFAGSYDGKINVIVATGPESYWKTGQLPDGYFSEPVLRIIAQVVDADMKTEIFKSQFLEKFEPLSILGEGHYGCVFKVKLRSGQNEFAVKRIPVKGSDDEMDKALREAHALAMLHHGHEGIVGYHNYWIEKPPPGWQNQQDAEILRKFDYQEKLNYKFDCVFIYIQMELCQKTLKDSLKRKNRDLNQAKSWFKEMVSAVSYIHQNGKIHRDLKPSNILFGSNGHLKICDFGLVTDRVISNGQEEDKTRSAVGTLMYMSPEQWSIIPKLTAKSDVFTLGLILIELCVYMDESKTQEYFGAIRKEIQTMCSWQVVYRMWTELYLCSQIWTQQNVRVVNKSLIIHSLFELFS